MGNLGCCGPSSYYPTEGGYTFRHSSPAMLGPPGPGVSPGMQMGASFSPPVVTRGQMNNTRIPHYTSLTL